MQNLQEQYMMIKNNHEISYAYGSCEDNQLNSTPSSLNFQFDITRLQNRHNSGNSIPNNLSIINFQQQVPLEHKKLPSNRQRIKENSRLLPQQAVDIMTEWYDRNYSNPYPNYRECEMMAIRGDITINQVKQWFVNVRRRTQNQFRKKRETVPDTQPKTIKSSKRKLKETTESNLVYELDDFLMKKSKVENSPVAETGFKSYQPEPYNFSPSVYNYYYSSPVNAQHSFTNSCNDSSYLQTSPTDSSSSDYYAQAYVNTNNNSTASFTTSNSSYYNYYSNNPYYDYSNFDYNSTPNTSLNFY